MELFSVHCDLFKYKIKTKYKKVIYTLMKNLSWHHLPQQLLPSPHGGSGVAFIVLFSHISNQWLVELCMCSALQREQPTERILNRSMTRQR